MTNTANNPASQTPDEIRMYPEGFVALRNGIFDHLIQSLMTPNELVVYAVMLRQCTWASGLWNGNSTRIEAALGNNSFSNTQIRALMRSLQNKKYIRSYRKKGARGNAFYAIHKYQVPVGDMRGLYLNAWKSPSYKSLVYEKVCEKDVIDTCDGHEAYMRHACDEHETCMNPTHIKKTRIQDVQDFQEAQEGKSQRTLIPDSLDPSNENSGQVEALARRLSEIASQNGYSILFDKTRKRFLGVFLQTYSTEQIEMAWTEYLSNHVDGTQFTVPHAARLFTETADQLLYVIERRTVDDWAQAEAEQVIAETAEGVEK